MAGTNNANLRNARNVKNNEFYTQLTDVSKELAYYKQHFKDKTVLCNCNDTTQSAFWKYFHLNFAELELKKLVSTCYDKEDSTYKMEYTGGDDSNIEAGVKTPLKGNGDFRSKECLDLLDDADIISSNIPFSLFNEYMAVLMEHKKKFLIVGNKNAVSHKEFFPLIKNNEVWFGVNNIKEFNTPSGEIKKFGNIGWYTNLDTTKRHEMLILRKHYTPDEYPKYDNYDAINVDKVADIPCDYDGVMGVPISFLDKYNPDQFEIITLGASHDLFTPTKKYTGLLKHNLDGTVTKKHIACNQCLTVGYNEKPSVVYYTASKSDKYLVIPYKRILIRRKG